MQVFTIFIVFVSQALATLTAMISNDCNCNNCSHLADFCCSRKSKRNGRCGWCGWKASKSNGRVRWVAGVVERNCHWCFRSSGLWRLAVREDAQYVYIIYDNFELKDLKAYQNYQRYHRKSRILKISRKATQQIQLLISLMLRIGDIVPERISMLSLSPSSTVEVGWRRVPRENVEKKVKILFEDPDGTGWRGRQPHFPFLSYIYIYIFLFPDTNTQDINIINIINKND